MRVEYFTEWNPEGLAKYILDNEEKFKEEIKEFVQKGRIGNSFWYDISGASEDKDTKKNLEDLWRENYFVFAQKLLGIEDIEQWLDSLIEKKEDHLEVKVNNDKWENEILFLSDRDAFLEVFLPLLEKLDLKEAIEWLRRYMTVDKNSVSATSWEVFIGSVNAIYKNNTNVYIRELLTKVVKESLKVALVNFLSEVQKEVIKGLEERKEVDPIKRLELKLNRIEKKVETAIELSFRGARQSRKLLKETEEALALLRNLTNELKDVNCKISTPNGQTIDAKAINERLKFIEMTLERMEKWLQMIEDQTSEVATELVADRVYGLR